MLRGVFFDAQDDSLHIIVILYYALLIKNIITSKCRD